MKPYGMKRVEHGDDDAAGIRANGRKTAVGRLPGPGGDARSTQRSSSKKAARRHHKRRARAEARRDIRRNR